MEPNSLLESAKRMQSRMVEWRRDIHQHPELGFEEIRTAGKVADYLESLGLEMKRGVGKTGVVGLLRGESEGPTLLLRADMDALPIRDRKTVPYRSTVDGKAHLCGHDAHTSMLMGAAQLLVERGIKRGNVKFMFQPAEEGLAGAKVMIEDGVLEEPKVDGAVALHVTPQLPTGRLAVASGPVWAATNTVYIRIIGEGGHAARPHQAIDSIPIAAQIITALQQIVSRQINPADSAVLTIGQMSGGYIQNVIASEVELLGTVRTYNDEISEQIRQSIERIVKGITESFGAAYEFQFRPGYPVLINDAKMADLVQKTSEGTIGHGSCGVLTPGMGGEDFAFVAAAVPTAMFRLGTCGGEATSYSLHHPLFDVDEAALPYGSAMLAAIALNYLEQ